MSQQDAAKEQATTRNNLRIVSIFTAAAIGIVGVLVILYAWQLPPFTRHSQFTDNAYVRGQTTFIENEPGERRIASVDRATQRDVGAWRAFRDDVQVAGGRVGQRQHRVQQRHVLGRIERELPADAGGHVQACRPDAEQPGIGGGRQVRAGY